MISESNNEIAGPEVAAESKLDESRSLFAAHLGYNVHTSCRMSST